MQQKYAIKHSITRRCITKNHPIDGPFTARSKTYRFPLFLPGSWVHENGTPQTEGGAGSLP